MNDATLGEFEQLLMLAVLRLQGGAYGAAIRRVLEERAGRDVSPGAIYTTLDRLEKRGLVRSWLGDPTPARGGKRKKHYRLQPAGRSALEHAQGAFARMAEGLAIGGRS